MWLHILLSSGFNGHRSFPFTQLRRHLGTTEWARREKELITQELDAFAARKVSEGNMMKALEKMEESKAIVDSGRSGFLIQRKHVIGWSSLDLSSTDYIA
jgi:hypothetical protein